MTAENKTAKPSVPNPPTNLKAEIHSRTVASCSWSEPENIDRPAHYEIEIWDDLYEKWRRGSATTGTKMSLVRQVGEVGPWKARILAVSGYGYSSVPVDFSFEGDLNEKLVHVIRSTSEVRIGEEFTNGETDEFGPARFRVTDIGTRVIVAIRIDKLELELSDGSRRAIQPSHADLGGPPYGIAEHVFDENDMDRGMLAIVQKARE